MTAALAASATLPPVAASKPVRVQRKRTRGWKMPPNTKCVDRSTMWGNPFIVGKHGTRDECIEKYRKAIWRDRIAILAIKMELRGYNLACFCKEGEPCHADVLLEIANAD